MWVHKRVVSQGPSFTKELASSQYHPHLTLALKNNYYYTQTTTTTLKQRQKEKEKSVNRQYPKNIEV